MLKVINPATEAVVTEMSEDTADSIREKYARARVAQRNWAAQPISERIRIIRRFREILVEKKEALALALTTEVGKPISQSRGELTSVLGRIDFFLENLSRAIQDEVVLTDPTQNLEERIAHEPLGVIVNISAWNYPYFVGSNVFVPALLAGNAVLYKPSEFASMTGMAIGHALHEAGVPRDVFIPVLGGGQVGAELLKLPVNGIFFTGSFATGQKIAEAASRRMIKMQLELGGKDPVYICDDADIASAAAIAADGAFYNTGQSCCSVERVYVHEKIYDRFVEEFLKNVQSFVVGEPTDEKTYIGPLTRPMQLKVLEQQVADARAKGARLLCGGKRLARKGNYFEPTVFADTHHSMELMREESFGPIIGLQKVKDDEEALRLINDTEYGLTAAIFTKDRDRATRVLAGANSGSVYWNCCDRVSPRLPWSGRGHSGIGSTLSLYGIQTFVQPKAWHLKSK